MEKTLFRCVKQVTSLAQKLTDPVLVQLSDLAGKGFAGWKHAVLLYLREHMDAEYEEIIDWAEENGAYPPPTGSSARGVSRAFDAV